jgi:tetratricopeptide (TPR) repeat protein
MATLLDRLRVPREAVWGITATGLLGLAAGCFLQTAVWRDSETLWRYTLSATHDNAYAHANLGSVLMTKGEPVEAAEQARKALAIESHNIIALSNLGTLLLDRGRPAEAIELYQRTVELNPTFVLGWLFLGNAVAGWALAPPPIATSPTTACPAGSFTPSHRRSARTREQRGRCGVSVRTTCSWAA